MSLAQERGDGSVFAEGLFNVQIKLWVEFPYHKWCYFYEWIFIDLSNKIIDYKSYTECAFSQDLEITTIKQEEATPSLLKEW